MRKLSIIFISGALALVGLWVILPPDSLIDEEGIAILNSDKLIEVPEQPVDTKASVSESGIAAIDNELTQIDTSVSPQVQKVHQRELIDYDGDWCQYRQLSESDRSYAKAELDDWKASVGRFGFNIAKEFGYEGFDDSYAVSEPYLEISKNKLSTYISSGEPFAMLAALDRDDFGLEEKFDVAEELLVLGYTGKAIQYLVIHEMANASAAFSVNGGKITQKIREHLRQILTYSAYSLENHDAIGFIELINNVEYDENYKESLNPALVLTQKEIEAIGEDVKQLSQSIESKRSNKGLPPLDRELSKIAKHELDRDIGMFYGKAPFTMQILDERFGDYLPQLETNECREKHSQLFAGTPRR
jgi:hypothetical protein